MYCRYVNLQGQFKLQKLAYITLIKTFLVKNSIEFKSQKEMNNCKLMIKHFCSIFREEIATEAAQKAINSVK